MCWVYDAGVCLPLPLPAATKVLSCRVITSQIQMQWETEAPKGVYGDRALKFRHSKRRALQNLEQSRLNSRCLELLHQTENTKQETEKP